MIVEFYLEGEPDQPGSGNGYYIVPAVAIIGVMIVLSALVIGRKRLRSEGIWFPEDFKWRKTSTGRGVPQRHGPQGREETPGAMVDGQIMVTISGAAGDNNDSDARDALDWDRSQTRCHAIQDQQRVSFNFRSVSL